MIQDNTTKWKVRKFTDFASNDALPVGFIYQHISPVVPVGSLPLFGAEYDRTLYADLWSWANENGLVVTEEEWQAQASAQGGSCAKFSEGNGTTTFRVPALKCWIKGATGVEEVGSYLDAGLPNITGSTTTQSRNNKTDETQGAFYKYTTYDTDIGAQLVTSNGETGAYGFNASLSNSIYGNSDTVQPPSIVAMYCIKAFGTVSNVGNADVGNVMQAVEQVQTELPKKANLGALSMPSTQGISITPPPFTPHSTNVETFTNCYTAPADGWLLIGAGKYSGGKKLLKVYFGGIIATQWWEEPHMSYLNIPLRKGVSVTIELLNLEEVNIAFFYAQSEV